MCVVRISLGWDGDVAGWYTDWIEMAIDDAVAGEYWCLDFGETTRIEECAQLFSERCAALKISDWRGGQAVVVHPRKAFEESLWMAF